MASPRRLRLRRRFAATWSGFAATILAIAFAGCPCGGNPGRLINAVPSAAFVKEQAELYVSTDGGIHRVSLDGTQSKRVFGKFPHRDVPMVSVVDVSLDLATWLLSDSYTNLWIGDPATGASREVKELHGRMSAAAISPDGKTIAAARHSDYSAIRRQDEEDTIFLIDVATGKVDILPRQTDHWPIKIAWAADGRALLVGMAWEKPSQWIDLAARTRTEVPAAPAPLRADPRRPAWQCSHEVIEGRGPELSIADRAKPEQASRVLVHLEGRTRGFHDYQADFSHAQLTPACEHVVFEHRRKVWVTDLSGAQVGPIIDGEWLFFVPRK